MKERNFLPAGALGMHDVGRRRDKLASQLAFTVSDSRLPQICLMHVIKSEVVATAAEYSVCLPGAYLPGGQTRYSC